MTSAALHGGRRNLPGTVTTTVGPHPTRVPHARRKGRKVCHDATLSSRAGELVARHAAIRRETRTRWAGRPGRARLSHDATAWTGSSGRARPSGDEERDRTPRPRRAGRPGRRLSPPDAAGRRLHALG